MASPVNEESKGSRTLENTTFAIRPYQRTQRLDGHSMPPENASIGSKRGRHEPIEDSEPKKLQKTRPNQTKEVAEYQNMSNEETTVKEASGGNAPSSNEGGTNFVRTLISAISVLRLLDQKRATRTECQTEQTDLNYLLDFYRPLLLNVPEGRKQRRRHNALRAKNHRFEGYLERREEQEENLDIEIECLEEEFEVCKERVDEFVTPSATLPDVAYLKNSIEFQALFRRCQFQYRVIADVELELSSADDEIKTVRNRIDQHASCVAAGRPVPVCTTISREHTYTAESVAERYSPAQDLQNNLSTLTWRRQRRSELQQTKKSYSDLKETLLRVAEMRMMGAGVLQPLHPDVKKSTTPSTHITQPKPAGNNTEIAGRKNDTDAAAEPNPLEGSTQQDALKTELPSTEEHSKLHGCMAASKFKTEQYDASHFVESVGAIAIKTSTREVCLIHFIERKEWLLAKGRRNIGESRPEAALREIKEETGYTCRMLPLTMTTRAPPADEIGDYPDEPAVHSEVCEPFMLTCRHFEEGRNVKLIWWYVTAIDETATVERGEEQFDARLFGFEEALRMLTFETDREVLRKAIEVYEGT